MDNDHDSQLSSHGCHGWFCVTETDSQGAKGIPRVTESSNEYIFIFWESVSAQSAL